MRIVSGKYRGRAINPPKNLRARPTTDFAKENLFNVLGNLLDFEECDVLDLFAGTGSISYEFASRGARSVTAVEINAVHHDFIRRTAALLGIENFYTVKANVFLYLKSCAKQFDVIFSDAPYDLEGSEQVVKLVLERGLLRPGGILAVQIPINQKEPIHQIIQALAAGEKWKAHFPSPRIFYQLTVSEYYDLLGEITDSFELWETVYMHAMLSHDAIMEWYRGTGLRPYLAALTPELQQEFEKDVLDGVKQAYPVQKDGSVIFPFPRLFFLGER